MKDLERDAAMADRPGEEGGGPGGGGGRGGGPGVCGSSRAAATCQPTDPASTQYARGKQDSTPACDNSVAAGAA